MIQKKSLDRFRELYEKNFEVKLDDTEVSGRANYLLHVYKIVYGTPLNNGKKEKTKK